MPKRNNIVWAFQAVLLAMLLLAGSCQKGEVEPLPLPQDGGERLVDFSVFAARAATKAAPLSLTDLTTKGIGVFAFHQKAKSTGAPTYFNKYLGEPTFMYNQQVVYDTLAGSWTYTPQKYWPENENDQLSFFAYAPYDSTTAWDEDMAYKIYGTDKTCTKISRHYTVNDEVEYQQDYLWSDPILNQLKPTSTTTRLQFSFRHLCARMSTSAKVNVMAKSIYVTVDTVKVTGAFLTSGTIVYLPASDSIYWTDLTDSGTKDYYPYKAGYVTDSLGQSIYDPFVVDTVEQYVHGDEGFMFVIPGTQDVTLTAIITQRSLTTSWAMSSKVVRTFTGMALEENKAYNFLLDITMVPVTFTGSVDASWTVETHTSEDNGETWN